MAKQKTPHRILAEELCKKYSDCPDAQVARILYKQSPKSFKNVDAARGVVRLIRGHKGNYGRNRNSDKSLFKPLNNDTRILEHRLPESFANDYSPYKILQSKTLIIGDTHIPYHNNKAIELAIKYGQDKGANCVLINGDLLDFANISRFEKDWRMRSIKEEFDAVRQFLSYLRNKFPKANIIFKEGNHDERWERYLYAKAVEIFDMPEFRLDVLLKFGELGITHLKDKQPINIGKLWVLHGHELAGGAGGVNPSRSTFLKTMTSCVVNHFHKTSSHTEVAMDGHVITVNSLGCLCGLNPLYMPINRHNYGFGYCEMDIKTGNYEFENKKIIKDSIY